MAWFSYDDVAEQYSRAAVPSYFAEPAEELVALLDPRPDATVLDLGAGTGVVAAAARRRIPRGRVVPCDLSVVMVRAAGRNAVAGDVTRLPFREGTADVAAMAFVLSHLPDPVVALREVRGVVTGRVGISSWSASAGTSLPGRLWRQIAEQHIDAAELDQAIAAAIPHESSLTSSERTRALMAEAGFRSVVVHERTYDVRMTTPQFLESRLLAAAGRYLMSRLTPEAWRTFLDTSSERIHREFGGTVSFRNSVSFAIAAR